MTMDPNQGGLLGLFSRMRKPDEETGLNFMNKLGMAASVLNPMNPQSGNYRAEMMARGQQRMQGQARNRTIAELQKRAEAGDKVAQRYLEAVHSRVLDSSQGFSGYLTEMQANERLRQTEAAANARAMLAAGKVKKPSKVQAYEYAVNQLGMTQEEAVKFADSGGITIGAQENAWAKGMGEFGVKQYTKITEDASAAVDMLQQTQMLNSLMADPDFRSGALAEPQVAYRKIVEALGGDPSNVGSQEAFQAVTSSLILAKMGGSLGAGFSDADRSFVERMAPQLSTTEAGNRLIIQMQNSIANRKIEIADFANQYIKEKGSIDQNFMSALSEWSDENPMFVQINPRAGHDRY